MIQIKNNSNRQLEDICLHHYQKIRRNVELAILKNTAEPLSGFLIEELKNILTGTPKELIAVQQKFLEFCGQNGLDPLAEEIHRSFSYPNFRARTIYNAYHLANELNVNVCPYCNRQYTFTVSAENIDITRPQFDHFFSNTDFPLLALSFYNLIPSCYICNATLKGDTLFCLETHFHPYLGGFSKDFKFIFQGLSPAAFEGLNEDYEVEFLIDNTSVHRDRIGANADLFRLKEIYGHHKDQIREVVRRYHISGGRYLDRLAEMFELDRNDQEELYLLAFGNYHHVDKHELRPLARFVNDIYDDVFLGINSGLRRDIDL